MYKRQVEPRVSLPENGHHADRVLVNVLLEFETIEHQVILGHWNISRLDVPLVAELLPDHLYAGREHQVRLLGRLALCPATLLPEPLEGEAPELSLIHI